MVIPCHKTHGEHWFIQCSTFTALFVLCPPRFPVLMGVPLYDGNKVYKSTNQFPNPSSHSSSISHDFD